MRTLAIILVSLLTLFQLNGQNILIANNNPGRAGGTNVFGTLQSAINAAQSGDIIQVVGSGVNYGSITVDKPITIVGAGLNVKKDNAKFSQLTRVTISSSNVRISGLRFNENFDSGFPSIIINDSQGTNNIVVDNCLFTNLGQSGTGTSGNIIVQNCILANPFRMNLAVLNFKAATAGIRISNNIIYSSASNTDVGAINGVNGGIIEHNIFVGPNDASPQDAFEATINSTIRNNIFYGVEGRSGNVFSENQIYNNISIFAANNNFQGGNGNVLSNNLAGTNPLLINMGFGIRYSFSRTPTPDTESPAIGAGHDGTDIGLTGGGIPWDPEGSTLSVIESVDIPPFVSQGSDLPVQIKARSN